MEDPARVLDRPDQQVGEQVPILERRPVQGLTPAPAADQVKEGVDPAEALDQGPAPLGGRLPVEQVDPARVAALLRQPDPGNDLLSRRLIPIAPTDRRPLQRQSLRHHRPEAAAHPGDCDDATLEADRVHRDIIVHRAGDPPARRSVSPHCDSEAMLRQANPRRQGDIGEMCAAEWLTRRGYGVWIPLCHSPDVDLLAQDESGFLRVQVKTSTVLRNGRFEVSLATKGGNRSWTGRVKELDPARFDYLFVLVADGRKWFVPAGAVGGRSVLLLGGPKYAEFEVDAQQPRPGEGVLVGEAGFEPA